MLTDRPFAMGLSPMPAPLSGVHRGFGQAEELLMGFHQYWHKHSPREGSGFTAGLSLPG